MRERPESRGLQVAGIEAGASEQREDLSYVAVMRADGAAAARKIGKLSPFTHHREERRDETEWGWVSECCTINVV